MRRLSQLALTVALTVAVHSIRAQPGAFPTAWEGHWEGTLTTIAPPDSVRNRIPVSLYIAPEAEGGAWTWRTIFNNDTVRGVRPYRLLVRDAARGRYATDEGNGIVLEDTWIDGLLVSVFQVGDRVLESRYHLQGDTLVHDLTWWSTAPTSRLRGQGANAEGGAEILTFHVAGRQRATMQRVRTP
jgi:hypothetical protein